MNETLIEKMIYIIGCGIHEIVPDSRVLEPLDVAELYSLAKAHSLTSLTAMVLEKTDFFSSYPQTVTQRWQEERNKAVRKNMLLDAERLAVFEEMENAGIWYMPLKGIILKDLYPR